VNAARVQSVTFDDVRAAAERLAGVAHRTPVLRSRTLDARTGAHALLKAENFQRMGAFKFRGAYNRLAQLTDAERERGVVAFSSGNHAQGVALAAQLLGVPAVIVMPSDAPVSKLAATRGYGAEVVLYERDRMNRTEIAAAIARDRGAVLVPPYDDPAIIAGQGTVVRELIEDAGPLDVLLVPLGGGGLLAGSALSASALAPRAHLRRRAGGRRRLGALLACRHDRVDPRSEDDRRRAADAGAGRTDVADRTLAVRRDRDRQRRRDSGRDAIRVRASQDRSGT
jgi:threonine dehydratase